MMLCWLKMKICKQYCTPWQPNRSHDPQSLGPAATYAVGIAVGNEFFETRTLLKLLLIGMGVAVASYGDISASALGVGVQLFSICSDATRAALLQHLMQRSEVKLTPLGTLFSVSPLAAVCLCLVAMPFEFPALKNHEKPIPWLWLMWSCIAASTINLIVFTLIGKTSALTTSVMAPLKLVATIAGSLIAFGTTISPLSIAGYSIAMVGIIEYQRERFFMQHGGQQQPQALAPPQQQQQQQQPLLHHKKETTAADLSSRTMPRDSGRKKIQVVNCEIVPLMPLPVGTKRAVEGM